MLRSKQLGLQEQGQHRAGEGREHLKALCNVSNNSKHLKIYFSTLLSDSFISRKHVLL